jgi:tRNA-uridine 2-sulfurtransferase
MARARIAIALSGGVDSSVAAALLVEAGYEVEGVSLRLWDSPRRDDRICSDVRDAGAVARALGIPHHVIDERERFEHEVVGPFVRDAAAGRTPSPCVACNSRFKLGGLLDWAIARGHGGIATGHYARVARDGGRARLLRGADPERDQSYFLFELRHEQIERAFFPVGEMTKDEVRAVARRLGLPSAEKLDSQDLCFGAPAALVAARGQGGEAGRIVDRAGREVGRHDGVEGFTVGQRRGLGVSAAGPLYVQAIEGTNVVVAAAPPRAVALEARGWNWLVDPATLSGSRLVARLRSRHEGVIALVDEVGAGRVRLRFPEPATSVAPGQAAVLYRDDEVVGGGWIERSEPVAEVAA